MTNTLISTASTDLSPLQAVIFDWAGTLVDFGSLAPTQIFVEAFASFGITITLAQARGPMGLSKWQHIHELLQDEGIRAQWHKAFGQPPADADVDAIYARFMPMQIAKVGEFSAPIDGAPELLGWLRAQGLKVGSCSGYPREVLNQLLPQAAANGLAPDHVVAGDEMAAGGRPGPFMALANVLALGIGHVDRGPEPVGQRGRLLARRAGRRPRRRSARTRGPRRGQAARSRRPPCDRQRQGPAAGAGAHCRRYACGAHARLSCSFSGWQRARVSRALCICDVQPSPGGHADCFAM
jgi:beta-phosphoglucomutase-like phosphatase (HAD superfamily)